MAVLTRPFAVLVLVACFLAVLAVSPGGAQLNGNPECKEARLWHLGEALKWSLQDDQAYHLGAAKAASELEAITGADCGGWETDAQPPAYDVASGQVKPREAVAS